MLTDITLMTASGKMTFSPGEHFEVIDSKNRSCKFQYLGITELIEGVGLVYVLDETHQKYHDFATNWFLHRKIVKIGG